MKSHESHESHDTCDPYILAEKYIMTRGRPEKQNLATHTNGCQDVLIPVALQYMDRGLYEEGALILGLVKDKNIKSELLRFYGENNGKILCPRILISVLDNSMDNASVNEVQLVDILKEHRDIDVTGKIEYLLGDYYYNAGLADEALESFLRAYEIGLKYPPLLKNIGNLYYKHKKDHCLAGKYFEEYVKVSPNVEECYLNLLGDIHRDKGEKV